MEQNFQDFLKNRTLTTQSTNKINNTKSFEELVTNLFPFNNIN